ncbi:MAG: hypothetical protein RIR88_839 [Actinomycetota bacterium]|jgi:hypothetical protein
MSNNIADPGEGHSPAAWTAVVVMLIAVALGTLAFVLGIVWLVWVSVALLVVGALSGWVLAKAGYGVNGPKFTPKPHHY